MKPLNHCLLAAACVLLPVFTASRCAAQDTDRLLHAGMLGLTMDEEQESAKAPLAISDPIDEEKTRWSDRSGAVIRYRIGGLQYKNDVMTAMVKYASDPGIVPLLGVSVEGSLCDYFSARGTFDLIYGIGTFQEDRPDGTPLGIWIDGEFAQLSLKYTALFHLPPRTFSNGKDGYFHPYLGLGVEFNWFSQTVDVNDRADISVVYSSHANGFGVHALGGVEYVFDGWSIGLELAWSAVEVDFGEGDASIGVVGPTDIGGTTALFTIGYDF
ncbi:MAG: hypothetical protein NZ935_10465 [Planctomycetes bacterium]|nr:hypothetical protein [Planctomycetota bacterium]